jgi:hypothetical protein
MMNARRRNPDKLRQGNDRGVVLIAIVEAEVINRRRLVCLRFPRPLFTPVLRITLK